MHLFSKYDSEITFANTSLVRELAEPTIDFIRDSVIGKYRYLKIKITPNRKVSRYDILANENMVFHNMKANGAQALGQKGSKYLRLGQRLLSYYVVGNEPLEMQFCIPKATLLDMTLIESSFDLMHNPIFAMEKRKDWMMPTPFVLTDAIVIQKKIKPSPKIPIAVPVQQSFSLPRNIATDTIQSHDPEVEN